VVARQSRISFCGQDGSSYKATTPVDRYGSDEYPS
jgi:hypothetical protein